MFFLLFYFSFFSFFLGRKPSQWLLPFLFNEDECWFRRCPFSWLVLIIKEERNMGRGCIGRIIGYPMLVTRFSYRILIAACQLIKSKLYIHPNLRKVSPKLKIKFNKKKTYLYQTACTIEWWKPSLHQLPYSSPSKSFHTYQFSSINTANSQLSITGLLICKLIARVQSQKNRIPIDQYEMKLEDILMPISLYQSRKSIFNLWCRQRRVYVFCGVELDSYMHMTRYGLFKSN